MISAPTCFLSKVLILRHKTFTRVPTPTHFYSPPDTQAGPYYTKDAMLRSRSSTKTQIPCGHTFYWLEFRVTNHVGSKKRDYEALKIDVGFRVTLKKTRPELMPCPSDFMRWQVGLQPCVCRCFFFIYYILHQVVSTIYISTYFSLKIALCIINKKTLSGT